MRLKLLLWLTTLLLLTVVIPENTKASDITTIQLTTDVTGRITLTNGEKVKYVTLLNKQQFLASSANDYEWAIKVGNGEITIPKRFTTTSNSRLISNKNHSKVEMITTKSAVVYSEPKKKSKTIATFAKDMRISTNGIKGNYYEVILGGQKGYIHKHDVKKDDGVPILIYHHLVKDQANSIYKETTSVFDIDLFTQQVNYLKKNNYYTISLKDLDAWMKKKQGLPGNAVVLTFDDANLSIEKLVYPILKENKMQATTFVIGNRVKENVSPFNMYTFQFAGFIELRNIVDVFDLEYHTHSYHEFNSQTGRSILQDASNEALAQDFQKADSVLKTIDPAIKASYFSYPYGKYNVDQESVLIENGVSLAFLNKGGKATINSPRLYVPRVPIQAKTTLKEFIKLVES